MSSHAAAGHPNRRRDDKACAAQVEGFAKRLIEGDARGAESIVEQLFAMGAAPDVVLARLVQPAMTRIGEMWECADVTVADEHLATTIAQQVLATVYERLLVAPIDSRGRILLASAEGDHHALGLRMAADVLEGAGYQVIYLGADVPTIALVTAVARHRPAVVGLSVTLASSIPAVDRAVAELAVHAPTSTSSWAAVRLTACATTNRCFTLPPTSPRCGQSSMRSSRPRAEPPTVRA